MRTKQLSSLLYIAPFVLGLAGCSEKSGVEERTKISTPEGTTTIRKDTKVETSGSNPPPVTTPGGTGTTTPR
jgi:hypothetical protein